MTTPGQAARREGANTAAAAPADTHSAGPTPSRTRPVSRSRRTS
ncbi:hypothetical protein [Streptomyces sp. P17]|nr:hypothetical protein [Streptomyces sp. P17]MDT9696153.1 hypothetical protein [Streptomyces sp. P17]